ncbi:M20/M25/M40 family metallo-hydrolase [Rudanella paleaurantiibacter]|uniref:M20/M25/M40 family metallo-hydrolase n=1 Tax=Rudanella paleaurantiibacter TaxID=2614655 RepID=A0A7J5TSF3_9BACT|nr:M28 family metallopeptidase [Rudanella paleaurantiibacter]KAB7726133.1 M20/M25/M40 family metallo-hydrolase [Rudanella paleaurantiibacter]
MKKTLLSLTLGLGALAVPASAQEIVNRDPQIVQLLSEVSADSLRAHIDGLVSFGTRHTLSSTTDPKRGIGAARQWILGKFRQYAQQSGGRMTASLDTWTLQPDGRRIDKPVEMANVMAILKGTDPTDTRVFLVQGHMDSRVTNVMNRDATAPGANDDGSGTAAVIELCRVLSKSNFPATIVFATLTGEEQGLLGAEHLSNRAVKEKWNLEAVLNNDIMGSNHSNETNIIDNTRLRVFSEGLPANMLRDTTGRIAQIRNFGNENDGKARTLARYLKEVGERYVENLEVVMIYRNDRYLRGGDHTPFVQRGFAAVRLTEMNENYDHQHQDLRTENKTEFGDYAKFMDFEYLRKNTAVNLATLANLAKAPAVPQNVTIEVRNLTNSTALYWKAPATGKVRGYYVLMRETHWPFWQKKFFTNKLGMTLPYSKDNYYFAVQAVSEDGNESLPVLPVPNLR